MAVAKINGKWHIRFEQAGVVVQQSTRLPATKANKLVANQIEAELRIEIALGKPTQKLDPKPFTEAVEDYLKSYAANPKYRQSTVAKTRGNFASLLFWFKQRPVHTIAAKDVEKYVQWRRENSIKENSIRNNLCGLRKFYRHAVRQHWAGVSPFAEGAIEMPTAKLAKRTFVLSREDEAAYLYELRKISERVWVIAVIAIELGLRNLSEAAALRWSAVDLTGKKLTIGQSKTKAGRRVLPLTDRAVDALRQLATYKGPDTPVFPGDRVRAKAMSQQAIYRAHAKALKAAKVPAFDIYSLRHTFATRAAAAGMPIDVLAKIMGHSTARVTLEYYTHTSDQRVIEEMAKLEKHHGNLTANTGNPQVEAVEPSGKPTTQKESY